MGPRGGGARVVLLMQVSQGISGTGRVAAGLVVAGVRGRPLLFGSCTCEAVRVRGKATDPAQSRHPGYLRWQLEVHWSAALAVRGFYWLSGGTMCTGPTRISQSRSGGGLRVWTRTGTEMPVAGASAGFCAARRCES